MIIDAMDLLYTERFDGFCLVSSDSDFTRLASRIREQGLTVYGFGERKTPKPFVTACDKFIYSDVLRADADAGADEAAAPVRRRSGGELRQDSRLVRLLQSASQAVSDEDAGRRWAAWATISPSRRPNSIRATMGMESFRNLWLPPACLRPRRVMAAITRRSGCG